jgi:dihydrofolate reductase/thymidylate synthase
MQNLSFHIISAIDNKMGIGINGSLPWNLPEDMEFFKNKTYNSIVIMGSKTFFSIPPKFRPLKNRHNIVITNQDTLINSTKIPSNLSFCIFEDFEYHIHEANKNNITPYTNVFIIGGQQIYSLFFKYFHNQHNISNLSIHITHILSNFHCDVFFPYIPEYFKLIQYSPIHISKHNSLKFRFLTYKITRDDNYTKEQPYINIASDILKLTNNPNNLRIDRTNTGIFSIFSTQMRFNIKDNIPILTTKKIPFKTCVYELLWFLKGSTDNKWLQNKNVHIWDGNSTRQFLDSNGLNHLQENDTGACYPFQWRHFGAKYIDCNTDYTGQGFDQIKYVINLLKNNPYSRRIFLSAWNPTDLSNTCLPPCHVSIQFFVNKHIYTDNSGNSTEVKYLSGHMYQRSADWFLGEPFNILSYTILIYLLAEICSMKPYELIISTGDTHIYQNHITQMKEQINKTPLSKPILKINPSVKNKNIEQIDINDFELIGYFSHPTIKGLMAV